MCPKGKIVWFDARNEALPPLMKQCERRKRHLRLALKSMPHKEMSDTTWVVFVAVSMMAAWTIVRTDLLTSYTINWPPPLPLLAVAVIIFAVLLALTYASLGIIYLDSLRHLKSLGKEMEKTNSQWAEEDEPAWHVLAKTVYQNHGLMLAHLTDFSRETSAPIQAYFQAIGTLRTTGSKTDSSHMRSMLQMKSLAPICEQGLRPKEASHQQRGDGGGATASPASVDPTDP